MNAVVPHIQHARRSTPRSRRARRRRSGSARHCGRGHAHAPGLVARAAEASAKRANSRFAADKAAPGRRLTSEHIVEDDGRGWYRCPKPAPAMTGLAARRPLSPPVKRDPAIGQRPQTTWPKASVIIRNPSPVARRARTPNPAATSGAERPRPRWRRPRVGAQPSVQRRARHRRRRARRDRPRGPARSCRHTRSGC